VGYLRLMKQQKLKIAILSIHSSPLGPMGAKDTGGMSTYLCGLSRALGEAGHQVDIYTRAVKEANNSITSLYHNVRLISIVDGLGSLTKYELEPHAYLISDQIETYWRKEKLQYNVLFSHYWISGLVGRQLKLKFQLPHLMMFHTLGRAKNELCPGESEPPIRLKVEAELAESADLLVVAAESERQRLLEYFKLNLERVQVLAAGIDRSIFKPLDYWAAKDKLGLGSEKVILALGRLEPVKGFNLLLNATALIDPAFPLKIVIVGGDERGGDLTADLKKKAARLNLAAKVIFTGRVSYESLPDFYNAAAVTVLPSYYESFGLVALESLACCTPLVAGPVGVIPELVAVPGSENYVYLVSERSPALWAEKISEVISKPSGLSPLVGTEHLLDPYHWSKAAERLAEICRRLNKNTL
jgi:D-inositol-3-phosphate glycosyltransferase